MEGDTKTLRSLDPTSVPPLVVLAVDSEGGSRQLLSIETVRADLRSVLAWRESDGVSGGNKAIARPRKAH